MLSFENPYEVKQNNEERKDLLTSSDGFDLSNEESLEKPGDLIEHKEDAKIPQKICERVLARIVKNTGKDHVPDIDDILKGLGLTGEENFYAKLQKDTDFFLDLGRIANSERERAIEEERKRLDEERSAGRFKKISGGQENWRDWEIEENIKDAAYIEQVKSFIKNNEDNPEEVKSFWKNFDKLLKNRQEEGECRDSFHSSNQIKNGIIGELAAERLLLGFGDYLKDRKNNVSQSDSNQYMPLRTNENDINQKPEVINFSIEQSTSEQDVFEQTDFFVIMNTGNESIRIPVQVKSIFSFGKESDSKRLGDLKIAEEHPCSLRLPVHGREDSPLWLKMEKFYRHHKSGMFIVLPHGDKNFDISETGFASQELKELFYKGMEKELQLS